MNNKNTYPTLKVVTIYTLCGGVLSRLLILPILLLIFMTGMNDLTYLTIYFYDWFLYGLFPAFIVGFLLSYFKITITKTVDYIKVFLMGFAVVFLCVLMFIIIQGGFDNLFIIIMMILLSLIGGISSTILAKFILPKS